MREYHMDDLRDRYFVDEPTLRDILAKIETIKQQAKEEETDYDLLAQWMVYQALH